MADDMRIAYLTNSTDRSGVGLRALKIQQQLRHRADIKIYEFNFDGTRGLLSKEGRPVDWVSTRGKWRKSKSINWVRLARRWKKYTAKTDRRDYDLWDITNQSLSFLANRAAKPTVLTVHDIIEVTSPQQPLARYLNQYLLSGLNVASHIIAVSMYTAQQIKDHYHIPEEKITVIYNGVGEEWQSIPKYHQTIGYQALKKRWGIDNETNVLLFVGSDHPRKKLNEAIEVLHTLIKQGEQAVLMKVGGAGILPEREKALKQIDQLGLRNNVKFVADISNDELNEIYNMSDVLLFPSINEGFGLPLVQAMAAGLPIVAVDASATPEIAGDGAILVEAGDTVGMAKRVKDMLNNKQLRNEVIARGLKQVKKFSWEESAQAVLNVYKKVL